MDDLSEFRAVYLEELEEQLQCMDEEVLRLEKEGQSDAAISRLFRAAHTLKGSSAAMGYEKMKILTHEMEHLLDNVRNRKLAVNKAMTNLFFKCSDGMKRLQAEIINTNSERSNMEHLIRELQSFGGISHPAEASGVQPQIAIFTHEVLQSLQEQAELGRVPAWVSVTICQSCEMKLARLSLIDCRLRETENVYWSDTAFEGHDMEENVIQNRWLLSTALPLDELGSRIGEMTDVDEVLVDACDWTELQAAASLDEQDEQVRAESESIAPPGHFEKAKGQTIRVNVERLENMMNLVGELVIAQTRIQQMEKAFYQKFGPDEAVEELGHLSDHLTRTIGELQESVMKVRMLPIEQLFNRFPRMVRDLAHILHKEVELVIEGKETELDRTLIEDIGDPLIHLIRNAIDHGIEEPDKRLDAGKPAKGTLRISASHEDNQVLITIQDDGAGIDPERIRQSAVAKGIIQAAEAALLKDQDAVHLIFHPGFSTAQQISDVSGRGVGMDIVRTEIERMNGLIQIETNIGTGTLFRIRLPLTLAIITGLLVDIGGRIFIIPMSSVSEIVRIAPEHISTVGGMPVVTIRNQVIPVSWLHDYFHYERRDHRSRQIPIVIVGRGDKRIALAVDELIGNQEIVIKSLGRYMGNIEGISGGTILGDGRVGLILEIGGIIKLVTRSA
ncbi:chemotaxis protein CheA [Paenibacillus sepulcri]|uniref:chemotaxis protein CheA n=1 Tax=Paenibacillus sepulcri TaxID=359917 RepID=UPI001AE8CE60